MWDLACTGFASATNAWALIFRAMIVACCNIKALLFELGVHVPVNWWGKLLNEGMEGMLGGENWHPDDNAVGGVQGKCVCVKIDYSLLCVLS